MNRWHDLHELPTNLSTLLGTAVIGADWQHTAATGSTNDDLKTLARAGAVEGTIVSTDEQLAGRGRRGRTWHAPTASSLLLSTLLRPVWLEPRHAALLTMLAAVACAEAIESIADVRVALKWPNDLLIGGRKAGGILVETELTAGRIAWAILGTGINIIWNPTAHAELGTGATSVAIAAGRAVERGDILRVLLQRLDGHYAQLAAGAQTELYERWRDRLDTLGRHVAVEERGTITQGIAEDVTPDGALLLRLPDGTARLVTAGEVSVRATNDHRPT